MLDCPWIADFRDLWTQNVDSRPNPVRPFERRLERKLLADADALVTVSDDWAAKLKSRYAQVPVHTITNGFDPEDFPEGRIDTLPIASPSPIPGFYTRESAEIQLRCLRPSRNWFVMANCRETKFG